MQLVNEVKKWSNRFLSASLLIPSVCIALFLSYLTSWFLFPLGLKAITISMDDRFFNRVANENNEGM